VSYIGFPSYALAGFLRKRLSPLAGNLESFVKETGHFAELLKSVSLQSLDTLFSLDCGSLFTTVPLNEALQVIINSLKRDDKLAEF
jgi:hypothetical protein